MAILELVPQKGRKGLPPFDQVSSSPACSPICSPVCSPACSPACSLACRPSSPVISCHLPRFEQAMLGDLHYTMHHTTHHAALQAMLGDVLHTAADEGRIHRTAACEHRELQSRPECQAAAARSGERGGGKRMLWPGFSPQLWSPYTLPGKLKGRRGGAGKQKDRSLLRARVQTANLSVPRPGPRGEASTEMDTIAKAPPFLFPNAWMAQRQGWLLQSPPQVTLVHWGLSQA